MLAQARRRNAAAIESGRVRILRAPAEALPFYDASFDRAIAINTVGHWDDRLAGLREARRVLRRNGRLVIASRHDALRPPPRELVSALLAAAFALPEEVLVPADPMRGSALLAALAR